MTSRKGVGFADRPGFQLCGLGGCYLGSLSLFPDV